MRKTSTYRCGLCKYEEIYDAPTKTALIYCDGDGKHGPNPMTFVAFTTHEAQPFTIRIRRGAITETREVVGDPGKCRSCKADVVFVESASGKKPPYNPDGVTHFETCPQAAKWRGRSTPTQRSE